MISSFEYGKRFFHRYNNRNRPKSIPPLLEVKWNVFVQTFLFAPIYEWNICCGLIQFYGTLVYGYSKMYVNWIYKAQKENRYWIIHSGM